MARPVSRAAGWLSWVIVILAVGTAAVGLLRRDVYRDAETFVDAAWIGNDLVTLLLGAPVLAWATWNASRKPSARLVWLGALAFMLYNYAFYLFGAAPNRLLIAYIALVAMSLLALSASPCGVVHHGQSGWRGRCLDVAATLGRFRHPVRHRVLDAAAAPEADMSMLHPTRGQWSFSPPASMARSASKRFRRVSGFFADCSR